MVIDGFEDGTLDEYSGDTSAYAATTANPFDGEYSLEATTTSVGTNRIIRSDVSWGPGDESTLQCWVNREHSATLVFGVQSDSAFYHAQLRDSGTSDTAVVIAKQDSGFTFITQTVLGIDRTQSGWLRLVVDWQPDGTISMTVYDHTTTALGSVTATDTMYGAGGVGVSSHSGDSDTRTTYYDTIRTVAFDASDVATHTTLNGEYSVRTTLTGDVHTMNDDQDIEFTQGDTQVIAVSVADENGTAVDLTGADITYTLEHAETTISKTRDSGITVTDVVNGEFEITLSASDTQQLRARAGEHQIEVTDSDGSVATILSGDVRVRYGL